MPSTLPSLPDASDADADADTGDGGAVRPFVAAFGWRLRLPGTCEVES